MNLSAEAERLLAEIEREVGNHFDLHQRIAAERVIERCLAETACTCGDCSDYGP